MIETTQTKPNVLSSLAKQIGRKKRINSGDVLTPLDIDCDPIGFIVTEGICRVVFPTEDGTDITKAFLRHGQFGVTPFRATPVLANSYIEAVTPSEVLVTQWSHIEQKIKTSPELRKTIEAELAAHSAWKAERWMDDRTLSSTERYLKLQTELEEDFERIPLHMIASYIGVSPVQLSRLRRKLKNT